MIELDRVQGEIRFREHDHTYWHTSTGKELVSVSKVISTVFNSKSWDGVDPAVVENARIRGSAVDKYLTRYVQDQRLTIMNELNDVTERVVAAHHIWEEQFHGMPVEPQLIVYNLEDGIAGTLDFFVDRRIVVDLKVTYSQERSWWLQLGAYSEYAEADTGSGYAERAGVIHVSPKVYKSGGVWMEYDVETCRQYWRHAVAWWKESQQMGKNGNKTRRNS